MFQGVALIAGDVPKRPNSGHRYNKPVPEHKTGQFGQRHQKSASSGASPPKSSRSRIAATGRTVMGGDNAAAASSLSSSQARPYAGMPDRQTSERQGGGDASDRTMSSSIGREPLVGTARRRNSLIKRFVHANASHIGSLDPALASLAPHEQVARLERNLAEQYNGDFNRYYEVLQKDERDLRLRTSHNIGYVMVSPPAKGPREVPVDGYETARRKQEERINRVHRSSRATETARGTPIPEPESFNRLKGTIAGYGGFAQWSAVRQLNAASMLKR